MVNRLFKEDTMKKSTDELLKQLKIELILSQVFFFF